MQAAQAGAQHASLSEADVPGILQLLLRALSQDVSVQKQAEATLASLEQPGAGVACPPDAPTLPGAAAQP